jgi:hypothetical protein
MIFECGYGIHPVSHHDFFQHPWVPVPVNHRGIFQTIKDDNFLVATLTLWGAWVFNHTNWKHPDTERMDDVLLSAPPLLVDCFLLMDMPGCLFKFSVKPTDEVFLQNLLPCKYVEGLYATHNDKEMTLVTTNGAESHCLQILK